MRKVYVGSEDGYCEVEGGMSDLEVMVEVIEGYVRERNWWVVVEGLECGISVLDVMERMEKSMKGFLKKRGVKDYWVKDKNWMLGYESSNIMSSDLVYVVVDDKEGEKIYGGLSKMNDWESDREYDDEEVEEMYNEMEMWSRENMKEVDVSEYMEVMGDCVNWMGDERGGELRNIVNGLKN